MTGELLLAREGFKLIEVKANNGSDSEFFIEGLISTTHRDKVDDIVSEIGQDDMVGQLKTMNITMDLDHESFRDKEGNSFSQPKNLIPVARIVDAKRVAEGTMVKAMLNDAHPDFMNVLKSIRKGFLHSFSIAFTPVKAVTKIIDGIKTRVLDKLNLLNVAITGVPINSNATFSIVTKSYIDNKMAEEIVYSEEKFNELKSSMEKVEADLKSKQEALEAKEKELTEVKSQLETKESEEKAIEAKSQHDRIDAVEKQMAEMKSLLEKVRETPMNKASMEVKSEGVKESALGVMSYI